MNKTLCLLILCTISMLTNGCSDSLTSSESGWDIKPSSPNSPGNLNNPASTLDMGMDLETDLGQSDMPKNPDMPSLNTGKRIRQVVTGSQTCILFENKTMWCLGSLQGQEPNPRLLKVNLPPIAKMTTSASHTCALLESGKIMCWGKGNTLGHGNDKDSMAPVEVKNIDDAVDVHTSVLHTCAVLKTGNIKCWGYGRSHQLGDGQYNNTLEPVEVATLDSASSVKAGGLGTIASTDNGQAFIWGFALEQNQGSKTPLRINDLPKVEDTIAYGTNFAFYTEDQRVFRAEFVGKDLTIEEIQEAKGTSQFAYGTTHSCFITPEKTVKCRGQNNFGQLGRDDLFDRDKFSAVLKLSNVQDIYLGSSTSCAVTSAQKLWCWGNGQSGQFGKANMTKNKLPVNIALPTNP